MLVCKGNRLIDNERVNKYKDMCHFLIRKFLPSLALFEASMSYDDLFNQCQYETVKALINFDPNLAMKSFIKKRSKDNDGNFIILKYDKYGNPKYQLEPDFEARSKKEAEKLADPPRALQKAEESIVYGRIQNYLIRTRWKYSKDNFGGTMQLFPDSHFVFGLTKTSDINYTEFQSVLIDIDKMSEILDVSGRDGVISYIDSLSEDKRNLIKDYLINKQNKENEVRLWQLETN